MEPTKSVILRNWQYGDGNEIASMLEKEGIKITGATVSRWKSGSRPNSRISGAIEKAAAKLQAGRKAAKIERIKKIINDHE